MAYGSSLRRGSRASISGGSPSASQIASQGSQLALSLDTVFRHQETRAAPNLGSANALTTNNYFAVIMMKTLMSFDTSADTPPTPNKSNHIAGASVFNGSRMDNFSSVIRLKNNDAVTRYLDLYECTLSFLEPTDWLSIRGVPRPVVQSLTGVSAGNSSTPTPAIGVIDSQAYQESLTDQHYMKKIGTIEMGAAASGDNTVELHHNIIPPKCRHANYGMIWTLFFHNDFNKNGVVTQNTSFNQEISFSETPSAHRIPFDR